MNVISARSPFEVIINETGQTGSKVELFIWNKGTTEPTIPTYIMSENIASVTQTETNYNISPYILEYINQINANIVTTPSVESNTDWCFAKVKTYKNVNGTFTLLNTITYVGINGYTEVMDGLNYDISDGYFTLLANSVTKVQYYNSIPYYNFLCERQSSDSYVVKYYNSSNTLINTTTFLTAGSFDIYNFKIPLAITNSVKCSIERVTDGVLVQIQTEKIEECKYTPVNVTYVNKYGGWQQLTFFKAQTNSISIKSSEYTLMQPNLNYNYQQGQKKSFNANGKKTIKLNTGWVYESYNAFIQELMLSDTVLIDGYPAIVKTQSLTYKTDLKDKNINFEMDFEYSNNLINDIV
jgi:hypothetical protein